MPSLLLLSVVGLLAQFVDGSLGMAYGATSASLLLALGLSPVTASASVHLAEVGTTLVSGASHWRFGNVHWPTVLRLGVPGAAGAFVGANVLVGLSTEAARPVTAGILLAIGVFLLARFARGRTSTRAAASTSRWRFLAPLGLFAGLVDATGGGGWGPVATPSLLLADRLEPRRVVGTVDTAEFLVAMAASVGFLTALGREAVEPAVVTGLLAGGVVAAPLAAWVVRRLDARLLGVGVGGLLVLTNARVLLSAAGVTGPPRTATYLVIVGVWVAAVAQALRARPGRTAPREPERLTAPLGEAA